jgi:hypothetical protein
MRRALEKKKMRRTAFFYDLSRIGLITLSDGRSNRNLPGSKTGCPNREQNNQLGPAKSRDDSPGAASSRNRERRSRKVVVTNNATSNNPDPNIRHSKPKYTGRRSERHERRKWTWQCGVGGVGGVSGIGNVGGIGSVGGIGIIGE